MSSKQHRSKHRSGHKSMRNTRHNTINKALNAVLIIVAFLLLAAVILLAVFFDKGGTIVEDSGSSPTYDSYSARFLEYGGQKYSRNADVKTILFIGIDDFGPIRRSPLHYNEGQADFLMLAILNNKDKTYSLLHINRDTITDVQMFGLGGKYAGTAPMQIALSHCYGSGMQDSCRNTVNAVSDFLGGVDVFRYFAMNMDGVALLNDQLGGITVTVTDDFHDDATLKKGEEVTLMGSTALTYVRARMSVGDGSNVSRMSRQRQYIELFLKKLGEEASSPAFMDSALTLISDYSVTDMTLTQLSDTANAFSDYTFTGIETIEGELGTDGRYVQFFADREKLTEQIIRLLYLPIDANRSEP